MSPELQSHTNGVPSSFVLSSASLQLAIPISSLIFVNAIASSPSFASLAIPLTCTNPRSLPIDETPDSTLQHEVPSDRRRCCDIVHHERFCRGCPFSCINRSIRYIITSRRTFTNSVRLDVDAHEANTTRHDVNPYVFGNLSSLFGWQMAGATASEDQTAAACSDVSSLGHGKWAAMGLDPENIKGGWPTSTPTLRR